MGLPVTKLFCVSTAVRTVSTPRSSVVTRGANSCQAKPFSSLPTLQNPQRCQVKPPVAAAFITTVGQVMSLHVKARCEVYPRTTLKRFPVPDEMVPWETDFPDYTPVNYTSEGVLAKPVWADKDDCSDIEFNKIDGKVDRCSAKHIIEKVGGFPRNPYGRTGITGRGCLGRWGPNHAADPIVTRWKRKNDKPEEKIIIDEDSGKPILQFVSVQRRDNKEWALPGGMVDPGENRTATLIREFGEEACNSLEASAEQKAKITQLLTELFSSGDTIYKGYVDDPRNTDNAWMETKAINFHDEEGTSLGNFNLEAGDDAVGVQWMDINRNCKLYASHIDFIQKVVVIHSAHW